MNQYFRDKVTPDELVWSFSGVRALYRRRLDGPEDVTRDYKLVLDEPFREAPLLTVYGGKITTYRRLAEAAMDKIGTVLHDAAGVDREFASARRRFPARRISTSRSPRRSQRWPFLTEPQARRLVRAYGTRVAHDPRRRPQAMRRRSGRALPAT